MAANGRTRRVSNEPSNVIIHIRLTSFEADMWARFAALRSKPLPDVIRDGMNAVCAQQCLCKPGVPICSKCAKNTSK